MAAATAAPWIRFCDPALEGGFVWFQALACRGKAEFVQAAELCEVRNGDGSVVHVEVFGVMGSVETPIIRRPRRPAQDRHGLTYPLICEERIILKNDQLFAM